MKTNDPNEHQWVRRAMSLALVGAALISGSAAADTARDWYVGGNVGQSSNPIDNGRIVSGIYNGGITTGGDLTVVGISNSDHSTGYRVFGGYQIGPHFAIEYGYFDLGTLGFTAHTNPAGSLTGALKTHGVLVDALASYPIVEKTSLFVRAGIAGSKAEADFSNSGAVRILHPDYTNSSVGYRIGVGANRQLGDSFEVRLEGEDFRLNDAVNHRENIHLISLGLIFRF